MDIENIVKAIAQDETINVIEYIENNLNILLDNYSIFIENIDTTTLYRILENEEIEYNVLFKIIKNIDITQCLKLLYHNNFLYNIEVLSIILIKLLDYKPLLNLCCSNNPFNFIRNNDSLKAIIIQLKNIYIFVYNENIKCKCFESKISKDFLMSLQSNYFNFNVIVFLNNIKSLILTLETIYSYYSEYYKAEKEFCDLDCKNLQEHMMYEEIFDNFVLEYRQNIKPININYKIDGNNGDINNILNFIF
tara:strand:- start:17714 stop:18460 length:747 start_codon:yes stop_codon:yes gene_type:complete